jgi:photosynthetic reaction center cytochrome c subunit
MRLLVVSLTLAMSFTLSAQEEKKKGPSPFANPKNLKVLPAENLQQTMQAFRAGLGVMCSYCHVQGDFASDENPKKETARMMIHMAMDINAKFADGKRHVSCYTCHRGETEPKMTPPAAQ